MLAESAIIRIWGCGMTAIKVIGAVYVVMGFVSALIIWATVSRNDCIDATGVLGIYCNTGIGISHAVSILLWPFFWL